MIDKRYLEDGYVAQDPTRQALIDEIKRLKRVNSQQAAGWKSCSEQLRDANVYIGVLEHENEMFQQQISDLENANYERSERRDSK